jgi:hypothetical protein
MAFTSLRHALGDWLNKRKLENFFNENKNPRFAQSLVSHFTRNKILGVANGYLKEQKKRSKIASRRKNSASKS